MQLAAKFGKRPNTVRRPLREGRIKGIKVQGRSGGEWARAEFRENEASSAHRGQEAMSTRELRTIYRFSRWLTHGVDRRMIREMIRRDFFRNGIYMPELDVVESVAKEIVQRKDYRGRTTREDDPDLFAKAFQIVKIAANVPSKDRHPESRTIIQQLLDGMKESEQLIQQLLDGMKRGKRTAKAAEGAALPAEKQTLTKKDTEPPSGAAGIWS